MFVELILKLLLNISSNNRIETVKIEIQSSYKVSTSGFKQVFDLILNSFQKK